MVLVRPADGAALDPVGAETEALIEEARRRRRRRWARGLALGAAVVGVVAVVIVLWSASGARSPGAGTVTRAGVLPNGAFAALHVAGPLAVAPDGALYVTDVVRRDFQSGGDRVLVRLPDGRFRVVAGTGRIGFCGDGGPAIDAELSGVSDLAVARNGTLYIADGGRIRTVTPGGAIHTIVGNGAPRRTIAHGTPALSAALGSGAPNPLHIALTPTGRLYIATGYSQILRLTTSGKLDTIRAVVASGPLKGPVGGWGSIAVDAHGNIDVSCGPGGWTIWQVAANGIAHRVVGPARGSGGSCPILRSGSGGAIYMAGVTRVTSRRLVPASAAIAAVSTTINGQYFPVTYVAFSPNGTLYADDIPGNIGFERHQQLRAITPNRTRLLWQEDNPTPG